LLTLEGSPWQERQYSAEAALADFDAITKRQKIAKATVCLGITTLLPALSPDLLAESKASHFLWRLK
jgi:hypothetical protein